MRGSTARKRSYSASSTKRARRTKAEIAALEDAIVLCLEAERPQTVRQVFYQLTVQGLIPKTEQAYNGIVVRLLSRLRRDGRVPYDWVSDNTRWVRKSPSYGSLSEFIEEVQDLYRRDLWRDSDAYVEVWCEKDALAGVLMEETDGWDVPLYVSKGFSSGGYLHAAAQAIKRRGKPAFIYQFGDHDPSGVWVAKQVERGLRENAPDAEIHFERVAVTKEQIAAMNLPTRPTKRTGNSHAKNFEGDSVELDAIPAHELRHLAKERIAQHVDARKLRALYAAEESEDEMLAQWAEALKRGGEE